LNPEPHGPAHEAGCFRTTHWSAILRSAQSQAPGARAALAELCERYWHPLYGFIRRRGYGPEEAQDLTQGFFLHLLEHRALRHVDPLKGKFRSFLLASLQNYLAKEADRARCLKRGGRLDFIALDAASAEERYRLEPLDCLTAETLFDARWAMTLLKRAMDRLDAEYAAQGKTATLEALKPFLEPLGGPGAPPYEEAANRLRVSVGAVKTLIHRARKRHQALLREEVARTVGDPHEVDEEIHALCEALITAEGRLEP
jgi:RNA polymerase sigma factor (sigma-70 family)